MILLLTRCVRRRFGSRQELKSLGPVLAGLMFVTTFTVCTAQQPASRIATPPAGQISDLVSFPSTEVEFIIGPQLKIGSNLNPHPWFDRTQLARGEVHGREFPKFPPMQLTGQVQVTKGNATVRGAGTKFLSEVDPAGPAPFFNGRLRVAEGATFRDVQVLAVESDTQLTLTAPYAYPSQTSAQADTLFNQGGSGWNSDIYINANYYDLGLCLYTLYHRTGNPTYLNYARKVADSWWLSPHIKSGTVRSFDTFTYSPRNSSLGGLILRALDGRPEMWDWLQAYSRYMFDNWVKQRLKDPTPYNGIRDGSYMLLYATWLARVLPDSFPLQTGGSSRNGAGLRAAFRADTETAAINYGRLQYPDGSWRWDDHYYTDADGGQLRGIMQPFMVGLLLNALVDVHRLSTKETVKANIKNQITKACRHLYLDGPYIKDQVVPRFAVRIRGFHYFFHGGTTVNPKKYERGDIAADWNTTERWHVESTRQAIGTVLPAYAYAYQLTKDKFFLEAGDELYASAFVGADGFRGMADGTPKNYNQNYRMGGRYLAWRVGAQSSVRNAKPSPIREDITTPDKAEVISPISTLFTIASNLASLPNLQEAQLTELVGQIEQLRKAFIAQKAHYISPESVLAELQAALDHAQTALTMLRTQAGYSDDARIRLGWMAARLKRAEDRVKPK